MNYSKSRQLSSFLLTTTLLFSCSKREENLVMPTPPPTPPQETNLIINDINISAGYRHTLVLDPNGKLYGWGYNENGELGETKGKIGFTEINPDMWQSISSGYNFSLGVKKDGTLWASGYNGAGQLGIGSNEDSPNFIQVGTDKDWVKVSAGYRHSLAIKKDGTIWAWGLNESFQLGDGSDVPSNLPKQVGSEKDWADITAGNKQSFAIKKDGSLWGWGYNYAGQLGLGHTNNMSIPTKVGNAKWKTIVAGILTTGGIQENGTLWMWGRNYHGELGNGMGNLTTSTYSYIPVQISGKWKKISIGKSHVLALKSDNTLWSWGNNSWGELGIGGGTGPRIYKNTPQQIGNDNDWKDISAGEFFTIAQKEDLTYWGWGINREKQILFSNDEREITTPIKIK